MKTYNAIDVAKEFLRLADADKSPVTHLKLQKLVFFAQLTALCSRNEAIHNNKTIAWDYGPVVTELYDAIKRFGAKNIPLRDENGTETLPDAKPIEDDDAKGIIRAVWLHFKDWSAFQLSNLTHRLNSPWSVTYSRSRNGVITHDAIKRYKWGEPLNVEI